MSEQTLEEIKNHALSHMHHAGYKITQDITLVIDPLLDQMGYATVKDGKSVIVVSEKAVKDKSAVNLLIHEFSHIYRIETHHPSHNQSRINTIVGWAVYGKVMYPYQETIIQDMLNHLMNIYADDITFKVLASGKKQLHFNDFFLHWVKEPSNSEDMLMKRWEDAGGLISAAFAEASLSRHNIFDTDRKVEKAVEKFLTGIDKKQAEKYAFFKTFLSYLPEEVEEKEYEKLLIKYIGEFLKMSSL